MKRLLRSAIAIFLIFTLHGCTKPSGVSFDENLFSDDLGLVRWKSDESLFTGETFMLVCEECVEPLIDHWPVHFIGSYKDGLPHGTFWMAKSGHQDHYFEYRDKNDQLKVEYREGKRINNNP